MAVNVGDRGTATSSLHPQGFVCINGVRIDARAESGPIEAGAEVVVLNGDHLGLIVRKVEPGQAPQLPNHGQRVYSSFVERVTEEGKQQDAERWQRRAGRRRYSLVVGASLGALAVGIGLFFLWGFIREQPGEPWAIVAATLAAGIVWGVGVFRILDGSLQRLDENYWRITTASACLALAGSCGGAVVGIPWLGLGGGLLFAAVLTLVLAAIVPVVVLLAEVGG